MFFREIWVLMLWLFVYIFIYLPHVQSTLSTQFHIPFRMLISYGIVFQQYIHSMRFGICFAFTLT